MSIRFNSETGVFSLRTVNTLYQMQIGQAGVLLHLFYGQQATGEMDHLVRLQDRGFSGNIYELASQRGYSLDTLPQEYSGSGVGDYRAPAVQVRAENGSHSVDLRYAGHEITPGREMPQGLPYVRPAADTETLTITLTDPVLGLRVQLNYHIFPAQDVIVRSARLINDSDRPLRLEKAATVCLDFLYGDLDVIHFHGRHNMERLPERQQVSHGGLQVGSRRGMSSHHHNPFVILCDPHTTERQGECYGSMLVYSGNHLEEVEKDQGGTIRLVSGIHPEEFSWLLAPGEDFQTPEAILSFSAQGLNGLSRNYHRILREQVIDRKYPQGPRPVLINSWEAAYFDFDAEKILGFARAARQMGMEMLVLDDGWFGKRNDDTTSLGDWVVNEQKLGCTMGALSEEVHALGMKFGLWFEPEMISEDSDLYRAHPDWALQDPDRKPNVSRNQLVLDMTREDVGEYIFQAMCSVLDSVKIEYVKWDFNRSIANSYSHALPADRQGELAHRFILGTYRLLSRLLERYPGLMIEGCSGGGGRFDAGMLFYCPQIWCSDDTDAIERLEIQRGTSYGYPVSAMGAHVSACPNHQSGRSVPLSTRGIVAQSGTFGYELNPEKLTEEEREEVRRQIQDYHRFAELIAQGDYYRLTELDGNPDWEAWMFVSPDRKEALVNLVVRHIRTNGTFPFVRLQGLDPDREYQLEGTDFSATGAALMAGGYAFPMPRWDYEGKQLHWIEK